MPKSKPGTERQRFWLTFSAETAKKPLIWQMSQKYEVIFNIRNSSVTAEVGLIALELEGKRAVIDRAIIWLRKQGVQVDPVEMNTIEG